MNIYIYVFVGVFIFYYFFRKLFFWKYSNSKLRKNQTKIRTCGYSEICVTENFKYNQFKDEVNEVYYDSFVDSMFIMVWVFFGVLIFSLIYDPFQDSWNHFFGLGGGAVSVFIGVMIGMIPGCGPQIAFANVYFGSINPETGMSSISRSAIAANSINQDGDAEFPLMTTNRKTFLTMAWLNAIPALIVGFALLPFY